jgi:hypothetical protein
VVVAVGLAACSGDDDSSGRSATTDTTATTPTAPATAAPGTPAPTAAPPITTPVTAAPATSPPTTAEPQRPAPVVEQQIVVAGPEEVVFDWTTDQCEPAHIPDIAPRAFRNAAGDVSLTIGHWNTYRMIGPSLGEVVTDCSTILLSSDYDPDPSQFDDSEWIGSPYTFDGETVYAIVHNEYRGDTHGAARPGQCPSGDRLPCLDTSFTMQISTDGGATFDDILPPPNHLVATLPYEYIDDSVPTGIRQPSNLIEGPDGFIYLFGNVSDHPDEQQWVCAMRTDDPADPTSWRFWDGDGFDGVWKNPYLEPVDPDVDKCAPLEFPKLSGSINEGIVFDETMGRYVMVGAADSPGAPGSGWGFYYSTSEDLVSWSPRRLLIELPINPSVADAANETMHAYPTIIDPDSDSLNFSTSDGQMYLYVSRFNFGGNSLDRDLLRFPIEVVDVQIEAPDWTFDDPADIDPAGGWVPANDLAPFEPVDGVLPLTPTGTDPFMIASGLAIPAEFGTLRVRMKAPAGIDNAGQLFFVTADDLDYDEAKSTLFTLDPSGEFVDYVLDMGAFAGWQGTIVALRLDPVEGVDVPVEIDRIWFTES